MPKLNQPNGAIKGFDPESKNIIPSFAQRELADAAVWIENGRYSQLRSNPSLTGGDMPSDTLRGWKFSSTLERLSALAVSGEGSDYSLEDAVITLEGSGVSDFSSRGAGAAAVDKAKLTIRNTQITTRGAGRSATIATEGAVLKVYDSFLTAEGGPLPADYEPVIGPGMMEPPYPLGLAGTARTHLSMDHSESYFYNCDFYAEAWGAISTDSSGGWLYLEVNDSRINVPGNGYGTYADNGCHNVFNNCDFSVGGVLAIQDGNSSVTMNEVNAFSFGNGFMMHGGLEDYIDTGIVEVSDSRLETVGDCFLAKSTNIDLYVKNSILKSHNGAILRTMVTDDEHYAEFKCTGEGCYGVQATFESMTLEGDIVNADTERKTMIYLTDAKLVGAVTGYPMLLLTNGSKWTATADSEVWLMTGCDIEAIDAVEGVTINARNLGSVNGLFELPSGGWLVAE